jgi:hypothetical protein
MADTVIEVLRRFLPRFRKEHPVLCEARQRAVWAITHCRTATMGGHLYGCDQCEERKFAYHSCNHRACPQCGRAATAEWVGRELEKRINAPYFMVTFTLPQELRELFFGPKAKEAFDIFFRASSGALSETLASPRVLGAAANGFTGVLHTWNQRLLFHPHIHYLVPGAGLDSKGHYVRVKNANFLAHLPVLSSRFRQRVREELKRLDWQVDPVVWTKEWGIHIQPFGTGETAIKYLGAYVSRTAIGDSRILSITDETVTFRWKDRAGNNRLRAETITGVEFIRRYLRHVLPRGLRSVRYFGFCHPAAKIKRERIAFLSGRVLRIGAFPPEAVPREAIGIPTGSCCQVPMKRLATIQRPSWRGPPVPL